MVDLHRSPQLAAPTLLVVGDVVRLGDPVAVVEEFVLPDLSPAQDSLLPVVLFKSFLSQAPRLGADEEPMA